MCSFLSEESAQNVSDRVHAVALRLAPQIRRRFRRKLGPIRHVFNVHDLVSETNLRLEVAIQTGVIAITTENELEHFILNIARCAAIDALRSELRRERRDRNGFIPQAAVRWAHDIEDQREHAASILSHLDDVDRWMLVRYASGASHLSIATALGLTIRAYRSHWRRLRQHLLNAPAPRRVNR